MDADCTVLLYGIASFNHGETPGNGLKELIVSFSHLVFEC